MHLVERWTRTGPNHLSYDATIESEGVLAAVEDPAGPLPSPEPNVHLFDYLEAAKDTRTNS